jgi:hypothetical protein
MTIFKRTVVNLVAAIAAHEPPRKSGIDAYIPAMLLLSPLLGIPVFALLLVVLRLATLDHPLTRQPYLPLGVDSVVAGLIIAAQLIQVWRAAIELRIAELDRLAPKARRRLRLQYGLSMLAAAVGGLFTLLVVLRN